MKYGQESSMGHERKARKYEKKKAKQHRKIAMEQQQYAFVSYPV